MPNTTNDVVVDITDLDVRDAITDRVRRFASACESLQRVGLTDTARELDADREDLINTLAGRPGYVTAARLAGCGDLRRVQVQIDGAWRTLAGEDGNPHEADTEHLLDLIGMTGADVDDALANAQAAWSYHSIVTQPARPKRLRRKVADAAPAAESQSPRDVVEFVEGVQSVRVAVKKHLDAIGRRPSNVRGASNLQQALRRADMAVDSASSGNYGLAANRLRQIDTTFACVGLAYRTPTHLQDTASQLAFATA